MANNIKTLDFNETSIPSYFLLNIKERWGMNFPLNRVPEFYRVIFNSIATYLKHNRSKSSPRIGFKLVNDAGEFRFGAILEYQKPEDGEAEDTGNWVLSCTFYEDDMKNLDVCIDNMSNTFTTIVDGEIFSTMYGHMTESSVATNMFTAAIESLKDQLSKMADSGEEVEVSLPGVFKASVGFEDGQKVFAIVPGHNVKQIIKDDKGLAK